MIGSSVSHYEVLEKLGEGGMGVVYKARDRRLGRYVALKLLRADAVEKPERLRRFNQEARAASALNHPRIVTIYDIGHTEDGAAFIAMEYVEGKALSQILAQGRLKPAQAVGLALEIAEALAAAHRAGIVHRDIKPANVVVGPAGVKVLDFGLAKLLESGETSESQSTRTLAPPLTGEGALLGTPSYMAPEQAEGGPADERADVFSFGALLYEMLSGRRAFPGRTRAAALASVLAAEPVPLSAAAPEVPRELETLVSLCLRKDPARRMQSMADAVLLLEVAKAHLEAPPTAQRGALKKAQRLGPLAVGIGLALGMIMAAIWFRITNPKPPGEPPLTRVTSDAGLTSDPTLSSDGKLLAYASDRFSGTNQDIWMQQLTGGNPRRLTEDPADEGGPSFSPDGSTIAYHSERDGSAIYLIPALGGDSHLLAKPGRDPRYSPKGDRIAYWVGDTDNLAPSGRIFIIPAAGGSPVPFQPHFADARFPVWAPDGEHILFEGTPKEPEDRDWWVAPAGGGPAVRTGSAARFQARNFSSDTVPGDWKGGRIVFSASGDAGRALFYLPIAGNWRIRDDPQQLISSTGTEMQPFLGDHGKLVFSSLKLDNNIWSIPTAGGAAPVRITEGAAFNSHPSLSDDGGLMAFLSSRSGGRQVWLRDMSSGKEQQLTISPLSKSAPVISRDGGRVAYSEIGAGNRSVFVVSTGRRPDRGLIERVCVDCGTPSDWSPNGAVLLYAGRDRHSIRALDVVTHASLTVLAHRDYPLDQAHWSPDGRWITFVANTRPDRARVFVAPYADAGPPPESEWTPLADGAGWEDKPRWSPTGDSIYFYSKRDGFGCIWRRRFDGSRKHALGPLTAVGHFHTARLSLKSLFLERFEITAARDRIAFNLLEVTGNIWMAQLPSGW